MQGPSSAILACSIRPSILSVSHPNSLLQSEKTPTPSRLLHIRHTEREPWKHQQEPLPLGTQQRQSSA